MPLPFVDHVGARIVEATPGASLLVLDIQPFHFNSGGVVHGAVPFTLADTGMGAALFPALAPTQACATIEVKIHYFRPVTGGVLRCRSTLLHRGKTTAALESVLTVDDRLVGKATGTFAVFERRAAGDATRTD